MRILSMRIPRTDQKKRGCNAIVLVFTALVGVPGVACAQESGPSEHGPQECAIRHTLPADRSPQAIEAWLAVLEQCQRDPIYLTTLGQMLNQQARYTEARDHLERALLFSPEHKEARVDYAIALAGVGDLVSAQAMLDALLGESDLPPRLRQSLQNQRNTLAGLDDAQWQTRLTATTRLGYDSNLSGAPNLGSLTLTVAGQPVLLPLDESYQARAGAYARADVQLEIRRNQPDGSRWDIVASLRTRHSPSVAQTGTSMADLLVERSSQHMREDSAHSWGGYAGVAAGLLQAQVGIRYLSLGAMAGVSMQWRDGWAQGCQGRVGGEVQQRQHQTNAVLTGHYAGLSASLSCEKPSGAQWLAALRAGQDMAQDNARPGGDQRQTGVRLAGYLPLAAWWPHTRHAAVQQGGLLLDTEASWYHDATGYSPILQDGQVRSLSRQTARLEYQFTVAKKLHWAIGAEWVQQSSSLSLFRLQSHGPYLALRASW